MTKERTVKDEKNTDTKDRKHLLVLLNDDIHSFDFVIRSLVEVCSHAPEQAEQCAFIAHFKGKCEISTGALGKLKAEKNALTERGLKVIIN